MDTKLLEEVDLSHSSPFAKNTNDSLLLFARQKICEKPQVVTDYEAGRGIPNNIILGKMERALGIKLRGKDRGKPLDKPQPK